jgi:hypothetical protein
MKFPFFEPNKVTPAITSRGVITGVTPAPDQEGISGWWNGLISTITKWSLPPERRYVDVFTTSSGNAVPKIYQKVLWNSANSSVDLAAPVKGDMVMLGFAGGSSEFPFILGHFPGKESTTQYNNATASIPVTAATTQAAAFKQSTSPPIKKTFSPVVVSPLTNTNLSL